MDLDTGIGSVSESCLNRSAVTPICASASPNGTCIVLFAGHSESLNSTVGVVYSVRKNAIGLEIVSCSLSLIHISFPEDEYVLWIADYRECPTLRWQLWQHTDSHRIPGIPGKVDRNVFSGSAEEFKKLIL